MIDALEPLLYILGTIAVCFIVPSVLCGLYQFVVNAIFDEVMPNLLLAPGSYPATAVAWSMLLGFIAMFVIILVGAL